MADRNTSLKMFYCESAVEWTVPGDLLGGTVREMVLDRRFREAATSYFHASLNSLDMDTIPSGLLDHKVSSFLACRACLLFCPQEGSNENELLHKQAEKYRDWTRSSDGVASVLRKMHVSADEDIVNNLRDVASCLAAQHDEIIILKADIRTLKADIRTLKEENRILKADNATLKADHVTLKADNVTLNQRVETLERWINKMVEQMKKFTPLQQVALRKLIERVRDKGKADLQQAGIACPADWNATISQPVCVAALQSAGLDEGLMITRYGSGSEQEAGNEAAHEITESMYFYAGLVCKHEGTKRKQYTNCFQYLFGCDPEKLAFS